MMEISVQSPFPLHAVPRIWAWIQDFRWRVSDDFGPASEEEFVRTWLDRLEVQRSWAVYRDGELGGVVTASQETPIVATAHCLFAKRFWGHETTLPALRLAFGEIYRDFGVSKIASLAFEDNKQLLCLVRLLGGEKEGVLRKHTLRKGELVNMIAIGVLRSDFEARLKAEEAAA